MSSHGISRSARARTRRMRAGRRWHRRGAPVPGVARRSRRRPRARCRPARAISSGTAAGRKSSGTMTSRPRTAEATAATSEPSAASPMSPASSARSSVPKLGTGASAGRKRYVSGTATTSISTSSTPIAIALDGPDRRARDRREHERVEQALVALGVEHAGDGEQRREQQRDPQRADGHGDRRLRDVGAVVQHDLRDGREQRPSRARAAARGARARGRCARAGRTARANGTACALTAAPPGAAARRTAARRARARASRARA